MNNLNNDRKIILDSLNNRIVFNSNKNIEEYTTSLTYNQTIPSSLWVFHHNLNTLNFYATVYVYDNNDNLIKLNIDVVKIDSNTVNVIFDSDYTGVIDILRLGVDAAYIFPTVTASITPSTTAAISLTPSNTQTVTPTSSVTPSNTATVTPSTTATISLTPTSSVTPSNTATVTPTNTATPSITPSHTATVTPTQTVTPTSSVTPSNTATVTPSTTATISLTPTSSVTPSNTATVTPTNTITPSVTPSISVSAPSASYQSTVLADNPLLFYMLNESSGTTATNLGSIGSSMNGTYAGTYTQNVSSGNTGIPTAVTLTSNAEVQCPVPGAPISTIASVTVEVWVNLTANPPAGGWSSPFSIVHSIETGIAYSSSTSTSGVYPISSATTYSGLNATITLSTPKMQHWVWTGDSSGQILYLNGAVVASTSTAFTNNGQAASYPLWLGTYSGGGYVSMTGYLAAVALYDTVLTPARITAHYNAGI